MGSQEMGLRTVFVDARAQSRQLRQARLVVVEGPDQGREFQIARHQTHVGRASINEIVLNDRLVSSTHFAIVAEEQGFVLRDAGSTNGTWLSGCQVREVILAPGVTFRVGATSLQLRPVDEVVDIPLSEEERFGGVIGRALSMREVFATLARVAPTELTCLIEGETGTGKERVARAIHEASRRKHKPYVVLDCSAIPRELMESYVFGHERGAFTGAVAQRAGAFEAADGGTLFLDEIGELDLSLQPKLLRVLESRELRRVGATRAVRADCRVIAATNRDLRAMVNAGTFREDLYFRLSIVNITLPSLSQRREDIPLLVDSFLEESSGRRPDGTKPRLSADALDALLSYGWPGNVRELKNVIARAAGLAAEPVITRADLHLRGGISTPLAPSAPAPAPLASAAPDISRPFKEAKQEVVDTWEAAYLRALLAAHDDNLSSAARASGLTRYHLRELLKRHALR